MITNFEELTFALTQDEKKAIKLIIAILKKTSKENAIKSNELIGMINSKLKPKEGKELNGVRLRKAVNYIRSKSMLAIIATSKGYYSTTDANEVKRQIKSLNERAEAIKNSAIGLTNFL